jgi:hypothetical protein
VHTYPRPSAGGAGADEEFGSLASAFPGTIPGMGGALPEPAGQVAAGGRTAVILWVVLESLSTSLRRPLGPCLRNSNRESTCRLLQEMTRVDPALVLAVGLVIGFVLGYAVRAAVSSRRRRAATRGAKMTTLPKGLKTKVVRSLME